MFLGVDTKMDAKLKKILVTPLKFDKEGEVQKEEFSTITLEVPLDSRSQREEMLKLFKLLTAEWVKLEITDGKVKPLFDESQPSALV